MGCLLSEAIPFVPHPWVTATSRADRVRYQKAQSCRPHAVQVAKKLRRYQSYVALLETGQRRLDVVEFMEIADAIGFDAAAAIKRLYKIPKKKVFMDGLNQRSHYARTLSSDQKAPCRRRRCGDWTQDPCSKTGARTVAIRPCGRHRSDVPAGAKIREGGPTVSRPGLQRIADMLNTPVMFFYAGMGAKPKKKDQHDTSLVFLQTKRAMRLLRAYAEIRSGTTKYALVVLAESLRNQDHAR